FLVLPDRAVLVRSEGLPRPVLLPLVEGHVPPLSLRPVDEDRLEVAHTGCDRQRDGDGARSGADGMKVKLLTPPRVSWVKWLLVLELLGGLVVTPRDHVTARF